MKSMTSLWKPAVMLAVLVISLMGAGSVSAQEAAPSTDSALQSQTVHVVQRGETLFSIAQRYGTTVAAIQTANGLGGTLIYVGQRLIIPVTTAPGELLVYRVQPGDTLFRIAQRYNTSVTAIQSANGWGPNHTLIFVGQHVFVPVGTSSGARTYVVKSGDTLFSIAQSFNTTVAAIRAANNLASNTIYRGQTLVIPAGGRITYTVQRGDYLGRIAARYGVSTAALAAANGITNPSLIYPGQVLVIP